MANPRRLVGVVVWGLAMTGVLICGLYRRPEPIATPGECRVYNNIRRDTVRYYEVQCTGAAVPTWVPDSTILRKLR